MVQTRRQIQNIKKTGINDKSEEQRGREAGHDFGGSDRRVKKLKVDMTDATSPNSEKQEVSLDKNITIAADNIAHLEFSSSPNSVAVGSETRQHIVKGGIDGNNDKIDGNNNVSTNSRGGFIVDASTESSGFGVNSNSSDGGFIMKQNTSYTNPFQTGTVSKYFAGSTKTASSL
ncbi:530_t:CDS:1, partial [Ambispora leptoticha]